ncbi:hypothetical protein L4D05_02145 [Vibrio nomapromontoriensis]
MHTVICNSIQSFLDMAESKLLEGRHVHCVFSVDKYSKIMIHNYKAQYRIAKITYSNHFIHT